MLFEGWRDVEDDHLPVSFKTVDVLISPAFSKVPQFTFFNWSALTGLTRCYRIQYTRFFNGICSHLSGLLRDSPIPILSGGAFSNRKDVKEENMPVSLIFCSHLYGSLPGGSTITVFDWNALSGWIDVKEEVMLVTFNSYTQLSLVVFPEDSRLQYQCLFRVERSTCYPVFLNNYRHLSSRLPLGSATPVNNKLECSYRAEDAVFQ